VPNLNNKVALVTGASSGIGRAAAISLANAGASVVVAARRTGQLEELAQEISDAGGASSVISADMGSEADVEAAVQHAVATYGRLDCAFNNAGVEGPSTPLHEYATSDFDEVMQVNVRGVWLCMKYEIAQMLAQGGEPGVIVNGASASGIRGMRRQIAYTASKHAVIGMTKVAAQEYGRNGIRVNAVCPRFTETDMVDRLTRGDPERAQRLAALSPLNRMGTPDEIAKSVVWLCSSESSYMSGEAMVLDGGMTV
jgi:NAD(P)-dependent dehydrogenase (short-subunit alcohol dehydrogenase family)